MALIQRRWPGWSGRREGTVYKQKLALSLIRPLVLEYALGGGKAFYTTKKPTDYFTLNFYKIDTNYLPSFIYFFSQWTLFLKTKQNKTVEKYMGRGKCEEESLHGRSLPISLCLLQENQND